MSIARTAVLALAVLSVTAGRPASAQTFQERWSPIPRADAAEKPLLDQDQTLLGRSQQQTTPPDRSHSHSRMAQQQPPAPVTQQRAHRREELNPVEEQAACFVVRDHNGNVYYAEEPGRRSPAGLLRPQYSPRVTAVCLRFLIQRGEPQSSSASRFTAGAFGFLTFTQCADRPDRRASRAASTQCSRSRACRRAGIRCRLRLRSAR